MWIVLSIVTAIWAIIYYFDVKSGVQLTPVQLFKAYLDYCDSLATELLAAAKRNEKDEKDS